MHRILTLCDCCHFWLPSGRDDAPGEEDGKVTALG